MFQGLFGFVAFRFLQHVFTSRVQKYNFRAPTSQNYIFKIYSNVIAIYRDYPVTKLEYFLKVNYRSEPNSAGYY